MLDALKATPSWDEGKVRLFACWCARQVWHFLSDPRSRQAVEVAEQFAIGRSTQSKLATTETAAEVAYQEACEAGGEPEETATAEAAGAAAATVAIDAIQAAKGAGAAMAASMAALEAAEKAEPAGAAAEQAQADKLREMFGNPFGSAH